MSVGFWSGKKCKTRQKKVAVEAKIFQIKEFNSPKTDPLLCKSSLRFLLAQGTLQGGGFSFGKSWVKTGQNWPWSANNYLT
jgi:hypothetical protein